MKNVWVKIATVLSGLIALYFLFGLFMLMGYTKLKDFGSNLMFFVAALLVSVLIFVGCVVAWRRGSRGPS